ncbi:MAG: hypothetical protein NC489_17530 [Ruminococcus flavefaciens]|nr:hypothetical protein [Ruminococcus flavefaciens]
MKVNITNLYGIGGTIGKAQQMVAEIAKRDLHYNELGIYKYPMNSDTPDMLRTRLDGIIASVSHGDIVIFQLPTWNGLRFDEAFVSHFNGYRGLKKIFFLHDVPPLMEKRLLHELDRYIAFYNRADLIILPSQNMADFLRERGLTVPKIVIQKMWDAPMDIDLAKKPEFQKRINFAANVVLVPRPFVQNWNNDRVELAVTADPGEYEWAKDKNIHFIGWYNNENLLADALRKSGGFGLLWHDDPVWKEYMKYNTGCKVGTYLGAGLPLIVHNSVSMADTVRRKNLGLTVDSVEEAAEKIEHMTEGQYNQMVQDVDSFGNLVRNGYFAKKLLTDAVFQLLYE